MATKFDVNEEIDCISFYRLSIIMLLVIIIPLNVFADGMLSLTKFSDKGETLWTYNHQVESYSRSGRLLIDQADDVYFFGDVFYLKIESTGILSYNNDEIVDQAIIDSANNLIYIRDNYSAGMADVIVKRDSEGEILWETLCNSAKDIDQLSLDDQDNILAVCGTPLSLNKMSTAGQMIWSTELHDDELTFNYSYFLGVEQGLAFVVVDYINNSTTNYTSIIAVDDQGNIQSVNNDEEWLDMPFSLTFGNQGFLFSALPAEETLTLDAYYRHQGRVVGKFDKQLQKTDEYYPENIDIIHQFLLDSNENLIILGSPPNDSALFENDEYAQPFGVILEKLSSDHQLLWQASTSPTIYPIKLLLDQQDNIVFLEGRCSHDGVSPCRQNLHKLDPDGQELFMLSDKRDLYHEDIVLDGNDNVLHSIFLFTEENAPDDDDEPGCGCF